MPLYEYYCTSCDSAFERRRPASEYAAAAVCASGHKAARRVVSMFAVVSGGGAPAQSAGSGCACGGGGCGCGH